MRNTRVHDSLVCRRMGPERKGLPWAAGVLAAALLFAVPSAASAAGASDITVASSKQLTPRLTELSLKTPALADPALVRVLLPAGYDPKARTRYPVLYLLH